MLQRICQFIIISIVILCETDTCLGQSEQVQDIRQEWLVYSENDKTYLPFIDGLVETKTIHFNLDLNQFGDYYLRLVLQSNTSVLIENRFICLSSSPLTVDYKIDSLKKVFQTDQITVSLFSEQLGLKKTHTQIIDKSPSKSWNKNSAGIELSRREVGAGYDIFIVSILIIFLIGLYVKRSLKNVFMEYFSFDSAFSTRPKSEALFSIGVFSSTNLMMTMLYGASMGFSIIGILFVSTDVLSSTFGLVESVEILQAAIVMSVALIIFMIGKYFLIRIVSGIFKLTRIHLIQYFDYFRITLFLTSIIFGIAIFSISTGGYWILRYPEVFLILFLGILIARPLFIYLKLNKLTGYKNLHLFSYLCGTEIIPLIIIIKFFLN